MAEEAKQYTLDELKKKLTEREKNFCHEYVVDWNGSRAARAAGYSEKTCNEIAYQNLTKLHIQQYIDFIKTDYEMLCGISKTKQLNELYKIAYSSIRHIHNDWIELTEWEELKKNNPDALDAVESIDTKIENRYRNVDGEDEKVLVSVEYVKIKLYSKTTALDMINKMQSYYAPEKTEQNITLIEKLKKVDKIDFTK